MAQRRNLPLNVQRAVFQENRELLSLFGKVSAERRRQRKEQVELLWGTKKENGKNIEMFSGWEGKCVGNMYK